MRFLVLPILLLLGACTPAIRDNISSNWDDFKEYSFGDTMAEFTGAPDIMRTNNWQARDLSLWRGRGATKPSDKGLAVARQCKPMWEDRYIETNGYWRIERRQTGCK